ncbi:ATP-binding protein, partial [Rhodococcus oxybenzonivorans]
TLTSDALAFEFERDRAAALAELDTAKTRFFQNISHEFRTPLTLLLGPLQTLGEENGVVSIEERRDAIAVAYRAAQRLQRLVDGLLDLSTAAGGTLEQKPESTDIGRLTADCVSMFASAAEDAGLLLRTDIDEGVGLVDVDQEMWVKVVLNLVSNALKYNTDSGSADVSLRQEDNHLILRVADTGVGIPADEQDRVFERFHRVEGAAPNSGGGVGIGLSLVADLAEALGGSVVLDSTLGRGSTFTVRVPRVAAPAAVPTNPARVDATAYFSEIVQREPVPPSPVPVAADDDAPRYRILLLEDHSDLRAYLTRLLAGQGWDVDAVPDADTAWRRLADRRPH